METILEAKTTLEINTATCVNGEIQYRTKSKTTMPFMFSTNNSFFGLFQIMNHTIFINTCCVSKGHLRTLHIWTLRFYVKDNKSVDYYQQLINYIVLTSSLSYFIPI